MIEPVKEDGRMVEFLDGERRGTLEVDFLLEIRGCPRCGCREMGEGPSDWYGLFDPASGQERSAGHYDITCPACGLERRVRFWVREPFSKPPVPRLDPVTGERNREHLLHLGGNEPSTIIGPDEFAREIAYCEAHVISDPTLIDAPDPARLADDAIANSIDGHLITNAEKCTRELLKFIPADTDEVPAACFRTEQARRTRAEHRDWFTRAYIDAQAARWKRFGDAVSAEWERRHANDSTPDPVKVEAGAQKIVQAWRGRVGLTRSTTSGPIPASAIDAHARWLSDKGGERLRVTGVDATGAKLSGLDLTATMFEDVTLDRADLSFTRLHGATLTRVRARGAGFASAMIAGTTLTGCDFSGAGMSIAKLGDATIDSCDFSAANLERTTWYRSKVSRCTFAGAVLTDAGLDHAEFTDCDFRGADLGIVQEGLLGSSFSAVFTRCDLRDTSWQGRDLYRVRLIDCRLAGAHGTPGIEQLVIERPDLSSAGDGSAIGTMRDVLALWKIDPDAPKPPPPPKPHELIYDLPDDEGDYLEDYLRAIGETCTKQLYHRGTELRFEVRVWESPDAPLAEKIEAQLAKFRYARSRRAQHREDYENPDGTPKTPAQLTVEAVLEEGIAQGLSFEAIVERLVTEQGFTRERALEAIVDPQKARFR